MMLLSLALIRHSVLSLSDGLPKMKPHKHHRRWVSFNNTRTKISVSVCVQNTIQDTLTDLSTNMEGESGRVVSKSFIAFHSLMQLWSEAMQLS